LPHFQLPAQKQIAESLEASSTQAPVHAPTVSKIDTRQQVKPNKQHVTMVDGGVSTQKHRVNSDTSKRTRIVTPAALPVILSFKNELN
jgi:hypothetical protein